MIRKIVTAALLMMAVFAVQAAPKSFSLSSPDGKLNVSVEVGQNVVYSLSHGGTAVLSPSEISMTLSDGIIYGENSRFVGKKERSVNENINASFYKKDIVSDNFNELTLRFKGFNIVFRAYNDGMAYRFISLAEKPFKVMSEKAEFAFPSDQKVYVPYVRKSKSFDAQFFNSFENTYEHIALSEWNKDRLAFMPLVVEASDGKKVCITESDLLNYPGMYLYNGNAGNTLSGVYAKYPEQLRQGGHNMLQMLVESRADYIAEFEKGEAFPWRIVIVSENDAQLADSDMVYRLAKPAAEGVDYSWVKPGKVAWDWWNDWNIYGVDFEAGINNETYKYYIDFAASHGIEYVILDEGWAVNKKADLMQIVPAIDLEELVSYASERNVGLILWAGYWAFDRDMENVCRHYSEMGIKGFKVDFMDRDDQAMVDFHRRAAEMAAKYHLMLDFHGTYKPAGLNRTYPNVINYEGVFGLEQMKWNGSVDQVTYDVTIPFIRMVAGPFDYTQGAMRNATKKNYRAVNSEGMSQGTRCRQLAEYVVFESPLNMLCDSPSNYMAEKECTEFIASVPTIWDETRALDGKIADYVAIARRSGDAWYVGAMTDWTARDMELDLSFLGDGEFVMEVYRDGANAHRAAKDYVKEFVPVPASGKVKIHMAPGGGFAARIVRK